MARVRDSLILSLARALEGAGLLLCALVFSLGGCAVFAGEPSLYPSLRDMPSLPEGTTPEAERQEIIKELKRESAEPSEAPDAPAGPRPAVPPRAMGEIQSSACVDDAELIAQAVPQLRGTLHGDWRPAVGPPPAAAGVTAAINAPPGTVVIGFAPGAAELTPADAARLKEAAVRFLYEGGESVLVQARGRGVGAGDPSRPGPLAGLSLGLKRASVIAEALIEIGIAANQIKIATLGDEEIAGAGIEAANWSGTGPDGAVIVFQGAKR